MSQFITDNAEAIIAFMVGIGTSIIGVYIHQAVSERSIIKRRIQETTFEIYKLISELTSHHFWIAANHYPRLSEREYREKCDELTWSVIGKLVRYEDKKLIREIYNVLLSDRFSNEQERNVKMDKLRKKLERAVNPTLSNMREDLLFRSRKSYVWEYENAQKCGPQSPVECTGAPDISPPP